MPGGNNGTATATPTGNSDPVSYLWSNGATTQTISGLSAGTYTVTITETPTCTATASYTVTEPPVMDVTCSSTDVTTNGGSDGTASVTASGGTPPYTYLWNTAQQLRALAA
ncbi:MAG: SprB repeat-containing protein [Sphingobacteriales bacterium]|nr:SprB repeat-containing protein [Sphingobacteriales bacterium]